MIVKDRCYPLKASLIEILLMRLPKDYPKLPLIAADYQKEMAGYRGEQALDYYLDFLSQEQYFIFRSLRLKIEKWTFQIDFLLLTTKFALIIEAKNFAGNLNFEGKFGQLIQIHNEKEKGYEDPTAQAERQRRLLKKWFEKYLFQAYPIDYLVVISNSNAILTTDSPEIPKKVCKPFKLLHKIEEIESRYSIEKIDFKKINKLCKLLVKHHTPKQINILDEYKILKADVLTGVRCPICNGLPMVYKYGKWYCQKCNATSKDAHVTNLNEYFLLMKSSITNSEFKEFFHLPTNNIAQKLLLSMNLPSTGTTRNRVYYQRGTENALPSPGKPAHRRSVRN